MQAASARADGTNPRLTDPWYSSASWLDPKPVLAHPSCSVEARPRAQELGDADHVAVDDLRIAIFDQLVANERADQPLVRIQRGGRGSPRLGRKLVVEEAHADRVALHPAVHAPARPPGEDLGLFLPMPVLADHVAGVVDRVDAVVLHRRGARAPAWHPANRRGGRPKPHSVHRRCCWPGSGSLRSGCRTHGRSTPAAGCWSDRRRWNGRCPASFRCRGSCIRAAGCRSYFLRRPGRH